MHKPVDLAAMSLPGRSWLGVVVIAAHNAEEALTAPTWLQPRLPELLQRFGVVPLAVDAERLYVGLALVTLFTAGWVALASPAAPRSLAVHSLIALYAIFFVNAFIPHVAGSVLLGGYTPGVFSAVALVVPYCLWYFKRALSEHWVGGVGFVAAFAVGGVLYFPAVWTLLGLRGR
jgi:Protein of unknown function with HXXEE motif